MTWAAEKWLGGLRPYFVRLFDSQGVAGWAESLLFVTVISGQPMHGWVVVIFILYILEVLL